MFYIDYEFRDSKNMVDTGIFFIWNLFRSIQPLKKYGKSGHS